MAWLNQNWPYLLLLIGVVAFVARRGGMGCAPAGHRHHRPPPVADAKVDPVSGEPVARDDAVTAVHGGRVYHFNSRDNRERFEAEPGRFVPAPRDQGEADGHGRHGGC